MVRRLDSRCGRMDWLLDNSFAADRRLRSSHRLRSRLGGRRKRYVLVTRTGRDTVASKGGIYLSLLA